MQIPGCLCGCVCSLSSAVKHINGFNRGGDINVSVGYASEKVRTWMLQQYLSDENWSFKTMPFQMTLPYRKTSCL